VDLNPAAVWTAARNVTRNDLGDRVLVLQGRAEQSVECRAELVIANLHAPVLRRIMEAPGSAPSAGSFSRA